MCGSGTWIITSRITLCLHVEHENYQQPSQKKLSLGNLIHISKETVFKNYEYGRAQNIGSQPAEERRLITNSNL